jgi:hypothetical protein
LLDHQYFTEDYVFCRRFRAIGGKVWVDPILELDHTGTKVFRGCLFDYLQRECIPKDAQVAKAPPSTLELSRAFLKATVAPPGPQTAITSRN